DCLGFGSPTEMSWMTSLRKKRSLTTKMNLVTNSLHFPAVSNPCYRRERAINQAQFRQNSGKGQVQALTPLRHNAFTGRTLPLPDRLAAPIPATYEQSTAPRRIGHASATCCYRHCEGI